MKDAAILFLLIVCAGLFLIALREHPAPQVAISPITPASAADDSRLYALCPTIVPWQAPKYVKEHRA